MRRMIAVFGTVVVAVLQLYAQDPPKQDPRGNISPEEILRRKEEAFKDAAEAYKTYKVWTARFRTTETVPGQDSTVFCTGASWVKALDEEGNRVLYWESNQSMDPEGQQVLEQSRSLYKEKRLDVTHESSGGKVVERYDLKVLDVLLPQIVVREGFVKKLEENFKVEIMNNPRYEKRTPDAADWGHLGFKTAEEFDAWWKSCKAKGSGNTETGLREDRPFKDKEDKFDRSNPANKLPGLEGNDAQYYYVVYLTPTTQPLKRDIHRVSLTLRPGDFLPLMIQIDRLDDVHIVMNLEGIQKDPQPEVKDEKFKLDTAGFTERRPQKE